MTTRDVAKRRLKRTTQLSIAATVVIGGIFASLAAGSTHFTKRVVRQTRKVAAKAVVQAPAPPLVAVQSSAPAAAPATPATPVAPAATQQAPVVVSGGS